jgi:hypothetical protein
MPVTDNPAQLIGSWPSAEYQPDGTVCLFRSARVADSLPLSCHLQRDGSLERLVALSLVF